MSHQISVVDVAPRPLAVVRERTAWEELPSTIVRLLDQVYAFLKTASVVQNGHNIVVYLDNTPSVEIGVEVSGTFEPEGNVVASTTPAGRAASAQHVGPESGLPATHQAVRSWCSQNGHEIAGPNWEIYGDWEEDPAKRRTEVLYLLRSTRGVAG